MNQRARADRQRTERRPSAEPSAASEPGLLQHVRGHRLYKSGGGIPPDRGRLIERRRGDGRAYPSGTGGS